MIKPRPIPSVDTPAGFEIVHVAAVKALANGDATPEQQRLAYDWIVKAASNIGGQSFRGGDSHATAFMEGRRFVGAQLIALQAVDIEKLKKATKNG